MLLLRLVLVAAVAGPASARTLVVGESHPTLAAALRAAADGDVIRLGAGTFYECAVIAARDVVLEGVGAETVISDRACEGKGLLVARGDNLTVRDLVLARARVADMNGAGIRLEAQGLTLERVRFENDQVGVLAGQAGPGTIRVTECTFEGGGVAGERPTSALMVGAVGLLVVERSTFADVKGGQVATGAVRTELVGNRIGTGVEPGAGPAVQAGGMLVMRDNVVAVGPHAAPRDAAILANGPGAELRGNRLENATGRHQVLLLDWTRGTPVLEGNVVAAGDGLSSTDGVWRSRASGAARVMVGGLRSAGGAVKRAVAGVFGP